ncbi:lysozyme inhibitor LprI family protein [Zoogloea sp. LCSB751]|uniref:lysozyme inhibitor LprI family protein n=1 Tax=Zoogloea sp. LCSB751 TaxID=1965277 RepID=UPI001C200E94|nr:lysozyme inhibitor LprI family protein [Zoogloea sp. LCSB751]
MRWVGLGLAVCLPQFVFATPTGLVPSERSIREECGAFSQAGMRDCLAKKADESAKALMRAEQDAVGVLSQWDDDRKYVGLAKTKLARANKAFAKYREVQCGFFASLSGGGAGNSHEMRRLACMAELNSRRAEQLSSAVHELPLK